MLSTLLSAIAPAVVTLGIGFMAAREKTFSPSDASVLNRLVMRYALPLSLFVGTVRTSRAELASDGMLLALIIGVMCVGYLLVFGVAHWVFRRPAQVSALQALSIAGPAVPFIGISVLGSLYGNQSTLLIAAASLAMNLFQVPLCIYLLSASAAPDATSAGAGAGPGGLQKVLDTLQTPVVWMPLLGLVITLLGVHIPESADKALAMLGSTTGGVALFASGAILFAQRVQFNPAVWASVIGKNLVLPGIALLLAWALGLPLTQMGQIAVTLSIPSASVVIMLAVQHQVGEQESASVLFLSTVLSVFSMSLFIALLAP